MQSIAAVVMDQRLGVIKGNVLSSYEITLETLKNSFTTCGSTYAVPIGYSAFAKCVFFLESELFTPADMGHSTR